MALFFDLRSSRKDSSMTKALLTQASRKAAMTGYSATLALYQARSWSEPLADLLAFEEEESRRKLNTAWRTLQEAAFLGTEEQEISRLLVTLSYEWGKHRALGQVLHAQGASDLLDPTDPRLLDAVKQEFALEVTDMLLKLSSEKTSGERQRPARVEEPPAARLPVQQPEVPSRKAPSPWRRLSVALTKQAGLSPLALVLLLFFMVMLGSSVALAIVLLGP